ncbi:MAG: lysophospholipid acyltransferase family protein [Anaerolineales bacterium]|jgi:lauroyl/myristoyl acyltransferase
MLLNDFINSQLGPWTGLFLGRFLPRRSAYWLGDRIASILASRQNSNLYRAVRSNQAVVRGTDYRSPDLDGVVFDVLRNAAHGYVDWFRALSNHYSFEDTYCTVDPHMITDALKSSKQGHGVVFVGAHMSSFNMFVMMMAVRHLPIQALSYHRVEGSYKTDNIFRERLGINLTPISTRALRQAIENLQDGGFVLTAVDRPDVGGVPLRFFGREVVLPIGHARLAIRTNANVVAGVVQKAGTGRYHVTGPRLIVPERTGDDRADTLRLAERILEVLGGYIKERPSEWMMFIPLWPDVIPARNRKAASR